MKLTRKVFTDLAIYMMGFGLIIGLIFPVFTRLIGIPAEYIDITFIIACLLAGLMVGAFNITLAKFVVGGRIQFLSTKMKYVNHNLENINEIDMEECLERCMIPVDSDDEIGEASQSFNNLVKSFLSTLTSETSIRNFTEIFTNELDLEKLSEKALEHLIHYVGASAGMVLIDKGGEIEVSSSYLIKNPNELIQKEIVQKGFRNKKRVLFDINKEIVIDAGLVDFKPKSILVEPIIYKSNTLGIIVLASTNGFNQNVLHDLSTYMHGLSLGMYNAITHDKLEQLAILDPLTKVYNRRFGMERFKEEFSRSIRTNSPLGVMMLDIDFFKKVNDTYGHLVGDKVLITVADIITKSIRKGDILIRYGGEEFMALLPGASVKGISQIAEKIRRIIEEHGIKCGEQDIKITISVGGTSIPEIDAEDMETIIQKADDNLYISKETGRNKITIS